MRYAAVPLHDERATRYAEELAFLCVHRDATPHHRLLTASPVVIPNGVPAEESVVQPSLEAGTFEVRLDHAVRGRTA